MSPKFLFVAAGASLALFLYSRTRQGETAIAAAVDTVASTVRGIRNNNPGNIRKGPAWQGLATVQSDPAFAQFVSMPYGIRALVTTLRTYQSRYGLRTIRGMVGRWAPPNENRTDSYVDFVAREVGIQPDYDVDMNDDNIAFYVARAIIAQECGWTAAQLISDADVRAGVEMAA